MFINKFEYQLMIKNEECIDVKVWSIYYQEIWC